MVFNAVSVHNGRKLSMDLFKKSMGLSQRESIQISGAWPETPLLTFHERLPTLKEAADLLVREAIQRTKGNQSMAARLLGVTQPALSSRLKKLEK
jgi:DNA-binding NtrC family response regulator